MSVHVTTSVAAAHTYKEDSSRVTASHNRLGLSLSKHIRHKLLAKINGKRRPWVYETLGRVLVDYSCIHTHRLASPRLATPGLVRRGDASERVHVFLPFSFTPHTCKCIKYNSPYK
jgi:hypothetical protein